MDEVCINCLVLPAEKGSKYCCVVCRDEYEGNDIHNV